MENDERQILLREIRADVMKLIELSEARNDAQRKKNYKEEYKKYGNSPEAIKQRSERNQARRMLGLKVGDPREMDHKNSLSRGGSNARSNLRIVSRHTNRKKGNKIEK